jgi:hypothetical protein
VNSLSSGHDFITVSSGGNDVGLSDLLNECVYTWNPHGLHGEGCDDQITKTKGLIKDVLPKNLDKLYEAVKGKLSQQGTAYITAYSRFFDETTNDCDNVSWHWYTWPTNVLNYQYLTQEHRHKLNELGDMVNQAIRDAASRAGDQFVVVDYERYIGELRGMYCMPGVKEPQPDRADILFYLVRMGI